MSSTSPDGPPRRRTGIGRIVFSVIAVLTVLAASAFSIRSASGGNDIRTNLTLIAPAAAGGGWDSFQRELQQTMRVNGLVNNVQVVNIPGAGGNIALGQLTTLEDANNLMVGGTGQIAATLQQSNLDPELAAAILAGDQKRLEVLLGARTNVICGMAPAEEEQQPDKDREEEEIRPARVAAG